VSTAVNSGRSATLQQNRAGRAERLLRAMRTPGGAVFILLIGLLAAIIVLNPSFGEPSSFIRFIGRTAPIAIAAIG
jgi:ribose transport system permease protein